MAKIPHETYMKIAELVSENSYCKRRKVGCIIVGENDNIISIGYNGTITGFANKCEDNINNTYDHVLHAESNALMKLIKSSSLIKPESIYCTLSPCLECAKLIIQSGITKVFYKEKYTCLDGVNLIEKAGLQIKKI